MDAETTKLLSDIGKVLIPAIVASVPGLVALYIAIRKTPHETKKVDAETSATYLDTAKTAEELVGIKDARIVKLEKRVTELEAENSRLRKEVSELKTELEKYCNGSVVPKVESKKKRSS